MSDPSTVIPQSSIWKAYTFSGSIKPSNAACLKRAAATIVERTEGRVRTEFHLGNTLPIKVSDLVPAVGRREIHLGDDTFFLNTVPGGELIQLPMLVLTRSEYLSAMKIIEPSIVKAYEAVGVEILGRYDFVPSYLFGSGSAEINSLDSLRGRRFRVARPNIHQDFLAEFGANSVGLLTPDVIRELEQGRVDGAVTGFSGGASVWRDHLTSVFQLPIYFGQGFFVVNRRALAGLSSGDREQVREICAREAVASTDIMHSEEIEMINVFSRLGMRFTTPSEAEFQAALQVAATCWDRWATTQNTETKKLLSAVREELRR